MKNEQSIAKLDIIDHVGFLLNEAEYSLGGGGAVAALRMLNLN